jgi:hypothetical protein
MLVAQSIAPTNGAHDHWSHVRCLPSYLSQVTQSLSKVPKHNVMIVLQIENDRSKGSNMVCCVNNREQSSFSSQHEVVHFKPHGSHSFYKDLHGPKNIYLPTHININEMMENAKKIKK